MAEVPGDDPSAPFGADTVETAHPSAPEGVLPADAWLDVGTLSKLFEGASTSHKFLFFRAILETLSADGFRGRIVPIPLLAGGMVAYAWRYCRIKRLSLRHGDVVETILKDIRLDGGREPTEEDARRIVSADAKLVLALTQRPRYFLLTPFFADNVRGMTDGLREATLYRLAEQEFETRKPIYRLNQRDEIKLHREWVAYFERNFEAVSTWAERCWTAHLQSFNPHYVPRTGDQAAVAAEGDDLVERPEQASPTEDRTTLAHPRETETPFDSRRATPAITALSLKGFARARAYRDLLDAYAFAKRLGYDGPREGVLDFLKSQVALRSGTTEPGREVASGSDRADELSAPSLARQSDTLPVEGATTAGHDGVEPETPGEGGASSPHDGVQTSITVADLLDRVPISVRLFNVSSGATLFREWTVAEALRRRGEFLAKIGALRNAGSKTIVEVSGILDEYRASSDEPIVFAEETDEPLSETPADPAMDEPIVEILKRSTLSVRAERLLAEPSFQILRLRDFVDSRSRFSAIVMATGNIGRRTLNEISAILAPYAEAAERLKLAGPESANEIGPRDERPPAERMRALIGALDPKQTDVLCRRYGLDGHRPMTLQEIGETVHVTRERVRQVEQKALRRFQKGPSVPVVAAFIAAEQEAQWDALASGKSWIDEDEISERSNVVDPLFRIAVDARFGGLRAWLDAVSTKADGVWLRSGRGSVEHLALIEALDAAARSRPCPLPVASLRSSTGEALELPDSDLSGRGWSIFEGYLCTGFVGSRVRRRVRLHVLAREISRSGYFDIGSLVRFYRASYPDDAVLSRVVLKEIDEARHLFQCVFDYLWLVLPVGQAHRLPSVPCEDGQIGNDEFEEGGGGYRIARMLKDGPLSRAEIARRFSEDGALSRSSVVPTLVANACFRRIGPGVFGLYGDDGAKRAAGRRELLTESDCRLFCHAKHSGVPDSFFPAWDVDYEMELTAWAHRHAPPDVFRSLLVVAEPAHWPVPVEISSQMESVRALEARWLIGFDRPGPLGRRFMDAKQFFRVLAYLSAFGRIGWVAVNRLTGTMLNRADAADILAFLVLTGLVAPGDDWQAPHPALPQASELFLRVAERQFGYGVLSWEDPVLAPVMDKLGEEGAAGWVFEYEAAAAVPAWRSGKLPTGRAFEGGETGTAGEVEIEDTLSSDEFRGAFDL